MYETKCMFCNKPKDNEAMIKGMRGSVCKECINLSYIKTKNMKSDDLAPTLDLKTLKSKTDEVVMGQQEAKKQLITELYKRYSMKQTLKNNIILVGNSGVGKTHLMRSLANILNVPFLEVDATEFSETGYKGKDVADMLEPLVEKEAGNKTRIEKAIVFIDEIDKITSSQNGEANIKVQHALLKMIEGNTVSYEFRKGPHTKNVIIDTSKILFIGAGACVGLEDIRQQRNQPTRAIGFQQEQHDENKEDDYIAQDLIEFGFIPEIIGRFPLVLELKPLNESEIKALLMNHPESILNQSVSTFKQEGIKLIVSHEDVEWLVKESLNHPLGVRSISHFITKKLNEELFDALIENKEEVSLTDALRNSNKKIREAVL